MISNLRLTNMARKIVPFVLAVFIALLSVPKVQAVGSPNLALTEDTVSSESNKESSYNEQKYHDYLSQYEAAARPEREIVLEAAKYSRVEGTEFKKLEDFEGMDGDSLLTGESGKVEWSFDVQEAGLYHLSLLYYPIEGKSSAIERDLSIDGKRPFREAAFLQFDRIWNNQKSQVVRDNQGNELRPKQVEKPRWSEKSFQDSDGYENEPFLFYFSQGKHTITLESTREPMVVKQLKLFQQPSPLSYDQVLQQYEADGMKATDGQLITIEGEASIAKSSPTLYPLSERSSAAVTPYSASKIKINTIGGLNWRLPGQWMEWEVDVPETGLYNIAFKTQQNYVRGIYSTRRLTIDGETPFKEMEKVAFRYKSAYRLDVMGGDSPYMYRLEKGKHTLRLEVSLGEFAPLIREVEGSLYNLNEMYRKILMITGTKPDEYRDYQIDKKIPDLLRVFKEESERLKGIAKQLVTLSGQSSDQEALLKTMAVQLDEMIEKPETVPRRLTAYKTNTGGLGTWVQQARQQPLEIDSIYVASPGKKMPKKGMGFASKLKHQTSTFISSFFTDYNQIGNISEDDEQQSITVWIGSGRDQANTMKAMIDETFTSVTGINVNLKLVNMGTLLPATLANQGPDIAMQIENDLPVNFAMRNASADLTQFADFEEVKERFRSSAIVPYSYDGGVYALPETQTFNMLFYRKDVLDELELDIPQTWDDVSNLLAVLSKNHMQFGLPVVAQAAVQGQNIPPNSMYTTLLFQNGGELYRNGGKESDLDSRIGIETFKQWTEFYTDYKLEREYDFSNRFRTGQMPIGIADYTTYNQLSVFAPEIRGMWGFAPVPGTIQEDGSINRDVPSGGSAVVMMKKAKDKDAAWEFMKWWTSETTQTVFGREMEGLMGAAARYPTANIKALDSLPWPVDDYENLKAQFEWVQGVPEVPGGYFTGRHLFNAFYKTVVGQVEARESIMDYVQYMQDEISTKRKEFGLPQ
ncbi:extracellular solute-binding protein [Paenibacillus sp. LHD-38]|nr:extracellular solute-binding protein [Paenibacillus sp. LHD-38]MDQ8737067.1 extracellular solute-binding protein [Paenibacillus sp. LHD-38]